MIKYIDFDELLETEFEHEGLVFQGCGGDPQEWLDGVNEMFKEEGLITEGQFENIIVFENNGLTNIIFDLNEPKVNIGKLAIWKLATYENWGARWLSDYQDSYREDENDDE